MRKIIRKIEYRGFHEHEHGNQTIFIGEGDEQVVVKGYWIKGSLLQDCDTETTKIRWFHDYYREGVYTRDEIIDEVIGRTVGQYVVVPQVKNKAGNPMVVCEGDVVECIYDGDVSLYAIVWDEEEQDFKAVNEDGFHYLGCCEEITIVGNIFDGVSMGKMQKESEIRSETSSVFKAQINVPKYTITDVVVQFARLWGQKEALVVNAKDKEIADMLKGYDSEEMVKLLIFWDEEYSGNLVEDTCEFFERKIEEMYQTECDK